MILQSLNELYARLAEDSTYEIAPPGFSPQKIGFRIILKPDGTLFDIQDARTPDENQKLQNVVMLVPGEGKPSGSGLNPCTLWDNTAYLLGYKKPDKDEAKAAKEAARAIEAFESARKHHLALEHVISDPLFSAVCRFFEKWEPLRISEFPIVADVGTGFGIFQIQGEKKPIHESKKILDWWRGTLVETADSEIETGQCLLTGETAHIARLHPKIKSVTGAQSSGASIVSFNATAYESYGKTQSYNAPVSEEAAFQYGTAPNSLLTGPQSKKHRIRIGDTTTVFWTEKPTLVEDYFAEIFSSGSQALNEVQDQTKKDQIRQLLEAIRSGGRYQEHGESNTPFYILGLAPNAARVAIRFFHRSTVADLIEKLHDHQKCLEIVRDERDPEFPAIWQVLNQIKILHRSESDGKIQWKEGKEGNDKFISLIGGALTRSILIGSNYPEAIFTGVVRRIYAEKRINYLRAAIIKAVLVRNHKQTIPIMLDTETTDTAYLHGRLFAVIEKVQEEGHFEQTQRKLEHTIKEKYFSSASATPAAVFPRLETLSVHHQRHLNPGRRAQFDKLTGDIKWNISATKKTHTLIEQGRFILGYYHQRKDFFTKKETAAEPETTIA